jgi:hypothetical protein
MVSAGSPNHLAIIPVPQNHFRWRRADFETTLRGATASLTVRTLVHGGIFQLSHVFHRYRFALPLFGVADEPVAPRRAAPAASSLSAPSEDATSGGAPILKANVTESGNEISCSIDETNRLRAQLVLRPLQVACPPAPHVHMVSRRIT